MQNTTLRIALALGLLAGLQQQAMAQDAKPKAVLVRPVGGVGPSIDAFSTKSFDAYDESLKITQALDAIKVETKEVPNKGDGVTTEVKLSDGKGGTLTKMAALTQLSDLLLRTNRQTQNIAAVQALQPGATQEVAAISPLSKMKALKKMSASTDALTYAATETAKQASLIQQQISTLKAMKGN